MALQKHEEYRKETHFPSIGKGFPAGFFDYRKNGDPMKCSLDDPSAPQAGSSGDEAGERLAGPYEPHVPSGWTGAACRILRHPVFWLVLALAPFLFLTSGPRHFNEGEAMYAEIAREMRAGGDWITPHLNGKRHFDKPPLLYWMIGAGQEALGETEFSARLWVALAALASIPVVSGIGSALYGRKVGWIAALVYAASLGPYTFGKLAMPDLLLMLWINLAILGYVKGYWDRGGGTGAWPVIMFASLALATLTKGLVGLGLPAAIIGLHALLSGRIRCFLSRKFICGLAVAAIIALPWVVAVALANPDFLGYFFIREHLLRFTGKRFPPDECLSLPVFLILTFVWTFPWLTLVPQALKQAMHRLRTASMHEGADLLPFLWLIVVIGLFSASHSRLEYYAMPAMPAFALLCGKLWADVLEPLPDGPSTRAFAAALALMTFIMVLAAGFAFVVLGPWKDLIFKAFTDSWPEAGWINGPEQAAMLDRMRVPALAAMAGGALFSFAALIAVLKSRPRIALGLLAAMMAPFFVMVHWGFTAVNPFESSYETAQIVKRAAGPDDMVVFQEPHEYMWTGGITYYTRRMVHILKDPKFEGVKDRLREPPDRFMDRGALIALWNSNRKVVVVADEAKGNVAETLTREGHATVVGKSGTQIVLSNGR